ncbi:hypothetical protein ACLOJK_038250 [Asimina triloba]
MEILSFFSAAIVSFFLLTFLFKHLLLNPPKTPPPPPSPPFSLPILGHLHLLKKPLHRWLSHLSNRYGPILLLQFGSRTVLVVSSPSALQQCFTNNDIILANRPRLLAGKYLGYNYSNLPWSSYGNSWRNLRRVTTIEIFSSNRINASSAVRNEEVRLLLRKLCGGGRRDVGFRKVELRQVLFELVLNVMMRIAAGKRYYGGGEEQKADSGEARKFQEIVEESFLVSAATNFLDFLPVLRWVGFGGGEKRIEELQKKRNEFLQGLVDERRRTKSCSDIIVAEGEGEGEGEEKKEKILLDALLGLQESDPDYYTDEILKGILVVSISPPQLLGNSFTIIIL